MTTITVCMYGDNESEQVYKQDANKISTEFFIRTQLYTRHTRAIDTTLCLQTSSASAACCPRKISSLQLIITSHYVHIHTQRVRKKQHTTTYGPVG